MFVRQPQFRNASADVQIFYGSFGTVATAANGRSWAKPPGVSHVYMMLIGGGASGSTNAGGSGAVTVWYGAAQNVPDHLVCYPAAFGQTNGQVTTVYYRASSGLVSLLTADGGSSAGPGASAMTANQFTASGFFQSVAGANRNTSASTTTFLQGGFDASGPSTGNYGYSTTNHGYFQLQPIIVGVGGNNVNGANGGIGCGGGNLGGTVGNGGSGMVLIASW